MSFLARLREPSTMAGIGVVLALFGVNLAPEQLQAASQVAAAIAGVAAIVLREGQGDQ